LIGVFSQESETPIVKEFFQLFKTPWEFYSENKGYDVVVCTSERPEKFNTQLLIIYSSEETHFDREHGITILNKKAGVMLENERKGVPIYGDVAIFKGNLNQVMRVQGFPETVALEIEGKNRRIIRVGFNIFKEIQFLFLTGQPTEYACLPTLDIHISILRNWILQSGISLAEIPPVPEGYRFIACLTHDIDFYGICNHLLDHTMGGFIYRGLVVSVINYLKGKSSLKKLLSNWRAVLSLPAVYMGIVEDFWRGFIPYLEAEKGLPSTFFLVPFRGKPGKGMNGKIPKKRSVRYDVSMITPDVQKLLENGREVGVHGIDAWCDPEKGREELERISAMTGDPDPGIRMHWLYFDEQSPGVLEQGGYSYDSTLGYNEAVGYRSGTTQAFQPKGAKRLLEVPLNIQDTALFYPRRMNLKETEAFTLVRGLLDNAMEYGGVLTINWHDRSLAPERLWGDFYLTLLGKLRECNPWFSTMKDAAAWFIARRNTRFEDIQITPDKVMWRVSCGKVTVNPGLILRVHRPDADPSMSGMGEWTSVKTTDFALKEEGEARLSIQSN